METPGRTYRVASSSRTSRRARPNNRSRTSRAPRARNCHGTPPSAPYPDRLEHIFESMYYNIIQYKFTKSTAYNIFLNSRIINTISAI